MLDLGQLRSFLEVAERGTVAAAAAALEFTPPAVSQHIGKLETELQVKLFDRADRRLRLTRAGSALMPVAFEMLDLDYRARRVTQQSGERPKFVIAGFASALSTLVVARLEDLQTHATLTLIESEDAEALRGLRSGGVDLVLTQEYEGQPVERDERLVFTPLINDALVLALPDDLSPATALADLGNAPWLVNGEGTRCTQATMRILETAGMQPEIAASVADNDTLLRLVAAGHGVTIVPELLLVDSPPGVTVAHQPIGISRTILAVHRKVTSDAVGPLIDLLAEPSRISAHRSPRT